MPLPKYLRNLDGTAGKPRLSEGTMLSEGPVNDCTSCGQILAKGRRVCTAAWYEGAKTSAIAGDLSVLIYLLGLNLYFMR